MESDDSTADLATPEELRQAIEALTKESLARLKKAATYCLYGTEFQNPLELINEAVVRAMNAAHGDKGRSWKRSVPFMAFMIMTIRGIANDSQESLPQTMTVRSEALAAEGATAEDALGAIGHHHPDVVHQAMDIEANEERAAIAKVDADLIDAFFANDDGVNWIIMGLKDGQAASDIRAISGMNQTQYETARKRFRRGLEKIFPGRSKS